MIFIYAVPAFLLLMAVEYYSYVREKRDGATKDASSRIAGSISGRDTASNLATYTLRLVVGPLERFIELPVVAITAAFDVALMGFPAWQIFRCQLEP